MHPDIFLAFLDDGYLVALAPGLTGYVAGQQYYFFANTVNTGAATINIDGLGAQTIEKRAATTLADGDILASAIAHIVYDGTNFQLMNPTVE